jgi:hypothetical protein
VITKRRGGQSRELAVFAHRRTCENGKKPKKAKLPQINTMKIYAGSPAIFAKSRIMVAVRAGRIPSPTKFDCVDCGKPAQVYDHRKYTEPLTVEPVCRSCNAFRGPAVDKNVSRAHCAESSK